MTKNNSNWKEIEEEFRKKFPFAIMDWNIDHDSPYGEIIANNKIKQILAFFKPYFQELEEKAWMYDELSK